MLLADFFDMLHMDFLPSNLYFQPRLEGGKRDRRVRKLGLDLFSKYSELAQDIAKVYKK